MLTPEQINVINKAIQELSRAGQGHGFIVLQIKAGTFRHIGYMVSTSVPGPEQQKQGHGLKQT
jgi:hypothetical protein